MNPALKAKIWLFLKDCIFQSVVFYVVLVSPLGNIGGGFFTHESSLFADIVLTSKSASFPLGFILCNLIVYYFFSWLFSLIPALLNVYFIRFNRFRYGEADYYAMKVLFVLASNIFYLSASIFLMQWKMHLVLGFPMAITIICYVVWVIRQEMLHKE